ncbi:RHS repeat-associated core domain-containing protein [Agrobacterium vitis]|nr:RHS repeat-associated core domain-containing protein [Agrobacterium vitis]
MKFFFNKFLSRALSALLVLSLVVGSCGSVANARFISPDDWDPTKEGVGTNRYAYAGNDPVNKSDPNGHFWGAAIGFAFGVVSSYFGGTKEANAPEREGQISNTNDQQQLTNMAVGAAGGVTAKIAGEIAADAFGKKENQKQLSETQKSNDLNKNAKIDKAPEVPQELVGTQDSKAAQRGNRYNSGPLDPQKGGTGNIDKDFDMLTGGRSKTPEGGRYPSGTQIGENGISKRPGQAGEGGRIDIPANGSKPHETLHY